jgi:hypothetical protein
VYWPQAVLVLRWFAHATNLAVRARDVLINGRRAPATLLTRTWKAVERLTLDLHQQRPGNVTPVRKPQYTALGPDKLDEPRTPVTAYELVLVAPSAARFRAPESQL